MKKFKFKSLICAVAALVFAVPMASAPAFANSGPPWEEGVTPTGVHCVHEDSVLEVQGETLTFNLGTPISELKEGEKYDTTVIAEYTFHNPTADVVNTKMAFPIGLMPNYAVDKDKLKPIENPITVNGEPVEYTVRHTYGKYNDFSEDVKKIKDEYITTDFFKPDIQVTEYTFKTNLESCNDALFRTKLPQSQNTKYICSADSQGNFSSYLQKGDEFSIVVFGENIDLSNLDWSVTRYNEFLGRHTPVEGSVSVSKTLPVTFETYVLKDYDANAKISKTDWYNGFFENINTDALCVGSYARLFENGFTEWYVYETSVEANGTFTNAVTANLFPRIYFNYEPCVYQYSYYLSPAKEWASFGKLTVNINTKLYMQNGEYYNPADEAGSKFAKTETGYTATFDALPETEFYFSMCSVQTPSTAYHGNGGTAIGYIILVVICVLILLIPIVVGATLLIIFLVRRKKRMSQSAPQTAIPPVPVQETVASPDIDDDIAGGNADSGEQTGEEEVAASEQSEGQTSPEDEKKAFCIYCGSPINANAKFCTNCGAAVPPQNPVPPVQPAYSAPYQSGNRRVNGFGIAGFAVSVVAWIFVELLTAFAFLLTAVGFGLSLTGIILRKKYPRVYGLAIAGLVISSAMLVLILIGVFLGLLAVLGLIVL